MSARTKLAVLSTGFLCAIGLGLVTLAARARSVSSVVGEARDDRPPTFNKDIAPIVFKNCAVCHHPGGSGPFNLLSYEDVSKRAQQIAIVTGSRFMPPWLPEPGKGEFAGERRLSEVEIRIIREWADEGAPEGDARDLPPLPAFHQGFGPMPEGFVRAETCYPYRCGHCRGADDSNLACAVATNI